MSKSGIVDMKKAKSVRKQRFNSSSQWFDLDEGEIVYFTEDTRHYGYTQIVCKEKKMLKQRVFSIENDIFKANFEEVQGNERRKQN